MTEDKKEPAPHGQHRGLGRDVENLIPTAKTGRDERFEQPHCLKHGEQPLTDRVRNFVGEFRDLTDADLGAWGVPAKIPYLLAVMRRARSGVCRGATFCRGTSFRLCRS